MADLAKLINSLGLEGGFTRHAVLGAGAVSESWRVAGPDGLLVLRRDRALARSLGLDRNAEWVHLNIAYAADLGPEPLAHDAERGLLVTRYLDGAAWRCSEPPDWSAHGAVMRRVHEVPATDARDFDVIKVASAYRQGICAPGADLLLDRVIALAPALAPADSRCFCHHDAHRGNLIGTVPARLIDWEYAALGDPLFDLAVICRFHNLQPVQRAALLDGWGAEPADRSRLAACCDLYDALAELWQLAVNAGADRRSD